VILVQYEQTSLFDFSSCDDDPIYSKLSLLEENEELDLREIKITRTDKFYEVEKSDEFHEGFKKIMDCYRFINANL